MNLFECQEMRINYNIVIPYLKKNLFHREWDRNCKKKKSQPAVYVLVYVFYILCIHTQYMWTCTDTHSELEEIINFLANGNVCLMYGWVKATTEKHYLFACLLLYIFFLSYIHLKNVGILDDGKGPFSSVFHIWHWQKQILGKEPVLESSDQSCSKYLPAIISDRHKQWVLKLEFLKQDFGVFYGQREK